MSKIELSTYFLVGALEHNKDSKLLNIKDGLIWKHCLSALSTGADNPFEDIFPPFNPQINPFEDIFKVSTWHSTDIRLHREIIIIV